MEGLNLKLSIGLLPWGQMSPFGICYFFLTLLKICTHFLQGKGEHHFKFYVALNFFDGEFNSGYITDISMWASLVAQSAFNAGDTGSIPGWGRSPGEGNGKHSLQYSCLENPMDGEAW